MNTIKAHGITEFLALIPQLLGYTPTDSIVVIPFAGIRSVGALRLDIPGERERYDLTNRAVSMVSRISGADNVAVVIYAEEHTAHAALAATLVTEFTRAGFLVRDTAYVTSEGGGSYGEEPAPVLVTANVTGDQHSASALPDVAPERVQAIQAASTVEVTDLFAQDGFTDVDLLRVIDRALAVDPATMTAQAAGQIVVILTRPGLRDVALATWCYGVSAGHEALTAQMAWEDGAPYPTGPLLLAGEGPRPDTDRLQQALALALYLAATTTGARERTATLGTASWLAWATGACTAADDLATAALAVGEHGLSEIVQELARRGTLPGWAFTV